MVRNEWKGKTKNSFFIEPIIIFLLLPSTAQFFFFVFVVCKICYSFVSLMNPKSLRTKRTRKYFTASRWRRKKWTSCRKQISILDFNGRVVFLLWVIRLKAIMKLCFGFETWTFQKKQQKNNRSSWKTLKLSFSLENLQNKTLICQTLIDLSSASLICFQAKFFNFLRLNFCFFFPCRPFQGFRQFRLTFDDNNSAF